jgi:hypothetical protein
MPVREGASRKKQVIFNAWKISFCHQGASQLPAEKISSMHEKYAAANNVQINSLLEGSKHRKL